jgi:hypothetical protein
MSNTHGKTSWDQTGNTFDKTKGTEFMRLNEGSNILRIVSNPYQYWVHTLENVNGKAFVKQQCSKSPTEKRCPFCEMGNKSRKRYYLGVIDKKLGMYKILDLSNGVSGDIVSLTGDLDWGPPENGVFGYDLDFINKRSNPPASRISIVPKPKKPLTADEIVLAEKVDLEELDRRSTPPTYEKALERFNSLNIETEPGNGNSASTDEDDDSFFKSYDSTKKVG